MKLPMHRTRIKFCGMTRAEDIATAVALGVDAIGLILVPRSPRCLTLAQARELRATLPPFVASVVLTLDADPAEVQRSATILRPTLWQFHGNEAPEDCARLGLPYLKAVPMAQADDAASRAPRSASTAPRSVALASDPVAFAARYPDATGFVLDSHAAGGQGGTGHRFDWTRVPADLPARFLLAGGLTPDNVFDAIRTVRPYAVDVSSGIESSPGIKNPESMRRFVDEVRRADMGRG